MRRSSSRVICFTSSSASASASATLAAASGTARETCGRSLISTYLCSSNSSGTSPATCTANSDGSKRRIRRTPLSPFLVACQNRSRPIPLGLTAPIPVIATRCIELFCLWTKAQYRLKLMDAATESPRPRAFPAFLAGLQGGTIGVLCMLAWLGVTAVWQQRSFWTAENLMASAFYGHRAIRSGFAWETLSGLAMYLVLYGLLGAVFAVLVRDRFPRTRTFLFGMVFALAWYYVAFRLIWPSMMPFVALLHVERSTTAGHVLYGAVLGSFPRYFKQKGRPEAVETAPETAVDPM